MAYSQEQIEERFSYIISEIEKGRSLRSVLSDDNTPSNAVFYEWVDSSEEKMKQYARACEERADSIFEEMLEIADNGTNDFMTIIKGDISYNVEDKEVTNRSKLRLDTRKWMLSKMQPKKYGEKLDVTTGGNQLPASQPVQVVIRRPEENEDE